MSNSRTRTSDDPVQIWPPLSQDPSTGEVVWDDSELIAHYDRVDAFVKKKLNALYTAQQGAFHSGKPFDGQAQANVNIRRPGSAYESPSVLKANTVTRSEKRKYPKFNPSPRRERFLYSAPVTNASHSLEAALHSERPEPTLKCDFQWIPPTLYPPDDLFRQNPNPRISSRRSSQRSRSLNRPSPSPQRNIPPISMPPLPGPMKNMEPILRSWYEAGFNLGREHALKKCTPMDLPQNSFAKRT